MSKNRICIEKTKHINIIYHFILDIMSLGIVLVQKIVTAKNLVDILMKLIFAVKFKHCLDFDWFVWYLRGDLWRRLERYLIFVSLLNLS